jgi:phage terminase large subunit GpA-like protein
VGEDGSTPVFPAGYVHLPKIDGEYVQQLCAETLITRRDRNGYPVREWHKMRERNEALDCYVYARAAASAAGLDRFEDRHWLELERQLGLSPGEAAPTTIQHEATEVGGLAAFGAPSLMVEEAAGAAGATAAPGAPPTPRRRVIRSRWIA